MQNNEAPHFLHRAEAVGRLEELMREVRTLALVKNEDPDSRDALFRIRQEIKRVMDAIYYMMRGLKPYAYRYDFEDDRTGRTVGPFEGTIYAEHVQDAYSCVAIDSRGNQYGENIVITPQEYTP